MHRIPVIGCKLKFLFDIDLAKGPVQVDDAGATVVHYLCLLQDDVKLSCALAGLFIHDCCKAHCKRFNENQTCITYKKDDIVMARISQTISTKDGIVRKILFKVMGPLKLSLRLDLIPTSSAVMVN